MEQQCGLTALYDSKLEKDELTMIDMLKDYNELKKMLALFLNMDLLNAAMLEIIPHLNSRDANRLSQEIDNFSRKINRIYRTAYRKYIRVKRLTLPMHQVSR